MNRGRLRIYLGAAPGVGKTFAMLDEGYRRHQRGTDVVVGFVETHGRAKTEAQLRDLEVLPRRTILYRGRPFEEMDVDAIVARRPEVALVDELAHTNIVGSRNDKRWQDIEALLAAGIDVVSTVNIQHLESLNDVVEQITGITQRETVPDAFARLADQLELIDMDPEALRRRMAHGNIYSADKIDASLANYFRVGNLTALRELALLWVADQVDTALNDYRHRHGIAQRWETRERIAVALTGAPGADDLIRRAARIANRSKAELVGIHVETPDGLTTGARNDLTGHRRLLTDLGGAYREVVDADIGAALVRTALAENATQLIIGASRRSRWSDLVQGSIVNKIAQSAGSSLDIHIIATRPDHEPEPGRSSASASDGRASDGRAGPQFVRFSRLSRLSRRRQVTGFLVLFIGLPLLSFALAPLRERLGFASVGFCYLLAVVVIGAVGGAWVAALAAVSGFLLLNFFFAEPIHTFTIGNERDAIALIAFLVVAAVVSFLVERSARRAADAARARSEAETLATMAGMVLRADDPLTDLVAVLVSAFDLDGVSVLRAGADDDRGDGRGRDWKIEASAGHHPPSTPTGALVSLPLATDVQLAIAGSNLTGDDQRVLESFATHLAVALESRRLRAEAAQASALAKANDLRTTLLSAVSHDLRTPLTTIKTSASSLLDSYVALDADTRRELLETIDSESDRLNTMVGNLLDLGRLEAQVVKVELMPQPLIDIVTAALATTSPRADRPVTVDLSDDLPMVAADRVLTERAVANLVENALRYSPPGRAVVVRGVAVEGGVELRIIDHGPGIPRPERMRAFKPFQRLDGSPETEGVGLGLAVAQGFITAMGGLVEIDETPGGGTTMIATLPVADAAGQPR